jgi:hypothetical protein
MQTGRICLMFIGSVVLSPAWASGVTVGGGADAGAILTVPAGELVAEGGLRELEGQLRFAAGSVRGRFDVEIGLSFGPGGPRATLAPEYATVGVVAGGAWLDAGFSRTPWRLESTDGWERTFVTRWDRLGGPGAAPDASLGVELGFGAPTRGVAVVAGWSGFDTWTLTGAPPALGPLVLGVHGRLAEDDSPAATRLTGGVWAAPSNWSFGGAEVAGRIVAAPVAVEGEVRVGFTGSAAAVVSAELFPSGLVRPALRLGWDAGVLGSVGFGVHPLPWVGFRAEAGWRQGAALAAVSATVAAPAKAPKAPRKS